MMANNDRTLPMRLSCRSVTVAIPTPKSKMVSANLTFLLQVADKKNVSIKSDLEQGIALINGKINLYVIPKLHFIPFTLKSAKHDLYVHIFIQGTTFTTNLVYFLGCM
ncbi:hypothetical protein HanXRQr2_Chr08g0346601 [Helianthus annuus]|uniref:Uncharacterized protein n=1 Tax=Helianthus annuus TaxID=4232 RepID=A0A9K3ND85_HELAN|nr:hypothetical protein HanXRQr2_Chr08g0346601 [Helianthus annuus]